MQKNLYCLLAGALLLALGGCGGGGGGGGGGGTATGGGATQPTETGNPLVAPAGPLGAVLAVNAADLQPVRAGARWEYRGFDTGVDSARGPYSSTVRHVAGANGAVVEEANNTFQSGVTDTTPLFTVDGTVQQQVTDPLGIGSAEKVMMTMLRSPVRVNDQYLLFQRSRADLGIDADGDHLPDLADVVVYSTVVGTETLTLPELGRSLAAVRIDTTAVVRVTRSSDGGILPPLRTLQSEWHASGVGVVRRSITGPSETVGPVRVEETLAYWDGVDTGLGATAAASLFSPAGGATPVPYKLDPVVASAVTGDTALLVLSSTRGLAVMDRQGAVQRLRPWPFPDQDPVKVMLHGIASDRAVLVVPGEISSSYQVRVQQLDAGGEPVGAAATIGASTSTTLASAWDGSSLWLLSLRFGTFAQDLVLQPFGLDGIAREPEQVLEHDLTFIPAPPRLAAGGGRVLATWVNGEGFISTYKFTLRHASGGPAAVQTLGTGAGDATSSPTGGLTPLVNANAAALYWRGSNFTARPFASVGDGLARIVALDSAGNPVRSAVALDDELLPREWYDPNTPQLLAFSGDRLLVAGFRSARIAPGATQAEDAVLVASVPLTSGPLATAAAGVTPVAALSGSSAGRLRFGTLLQLVPWAGDRATVIGADIATSTFSNFWLP